MNTFLRWLEKMSYTSRVYCFNGAFFDQPSKPSHQVIFTGFSKKGFRRNGKGGHLVIPSICRNLRKSNIATFFSICERDTLRLMKSTTPTVIINVFGEDAHQINNSLVDEIENNVDIIFNKSTVGPILADKLKSLEYLTSFDVPMPGPPKLGMLTFENGKFGSGSKSTRLLEPCEELNDEKYNREFVDTRINFEGRSYYTSVRILCIGAKIMYAFPRARLTCQGIPNANNKSTPLDPKLINFLKKSLIDENLSQLENIANKVYGATGLAFLAHDILIDNHGSNAYLCETGFKFDDIGFRKKIDVISNELDGFYFLTDIKSYTNSLTLELITLIESNSTTKT